MASEPEQQNAAAWAAFHERGDDLLDLEKEIEQLRAENERLESALKGVLFFVSEDFKNGPDGPAVATDGYRQAYRDGLKALNIKDERAEPQP